MKVRIASIDIFRAFTMLLMIFVNDLWTLHDIPLWLEHTGARDDAMGLADVVFPAFLFIVGLSVPFAIKARIKKGDSPANIFIHIIRRSLALIVMGFYMVNEDGLLFLNEGSKILWQVLMLIAFILIWNSYEQKRFAGVRVWILQFTGIAILIILAVLYRGGSPDNPQWMSPQWWGILGLIGWAYLLCASLYLITLQHGWMIPLLCLAFHVLNLFEAMPATRWIPHPLLIVSASNYALVMSGILATHVYLQVRDHPKRYMFPLVLLIPACIFMVYGFAVRPFGGISKIMATPAWTAICTAISYITFAIIFVISDFLGYVKWAGIIMPAGTNTLTCYLLPGLVYPFLWPLQKLLPESLLSGSIGLIKSLLFALLIILLTGLLEKVSIRLKI